MGVREFAEKLSEIERRSLLALKQIDKWANVYEIAGQAELSESQVRKAVEWLKEKKFVEEERVQKQELCLLDNAEKYLKEGFPERVFVKVLKESGGKALLGTVAELGKLLRDEFNFALGFLKKKGYIGISEGQAVLTNLGDEWYGRDYPPREILEKIRDKPMLLGDFDKTLVGSAADLVSRKGILGLVIRHFSKYRLTGDGRRSFGYLSAEGEVGRLTPKMIELGSWKGKKFRKYNVDAPVPRAFAGKKQVYLNFLDEVCDILRGMGFAEMTGPLVEHAFFNMDALFMPQDHPARSIHDAYYVKRPRKRGSLRGYEKYVRAVKRVCENGGNTGSTGWKIPFSEEESERLVLRTQGTALSARTLISQNLKIPGKYFAMARCYRPDIVDATHLTEFNQMEGIILGEGLNFRELLGMLKEFALKLAGVKKVRFVPGYFPFTEPSVEGHIWHPKLKKWVEVLPAGIFRPELTKPLGINVPVLAWGAGIDRLFMIKHNISDIRELFSHDLSWLGGAKCL